MNTGQMATILVSVLVCGVLIAGMLPIFGNVSASEDTFTNDEYFITMDKIDASSEHIIEWTKDTSTKITVDGVDVFPNWSSITIVAEEDNLIRCSKSATPGSNEYYLNFVGADRPVGAGSISDKSVTILISEGVITFTGVTSADATYSFTSTFSTGYVINPNDDGEYQYVMKTPDAKAYVLGDSEIYGIGYSVVGGAWQNIFVISGTIDDGLDVTLVSTTLEDAPTVDNIETYSTEINGYNDLYQFEKVTFDAEYNDATTTLTYSYVIVPSEVSAERTVHMTDVMSTIIQLVPLLAVVGLVLATIGYVLYKRL